MNYRTCFATLSRPVLVSAALFLSTLLPATASLVVDKRLVVNVITVCDNVGSNCASTGPAGNAYFAAETNKIWAQAGIEVSFVDLPTLNSTALLNGATGVPDFTAPLVGPGTTMWLVNSLVCPSCTLFGEAWSNSGGLVIDMGAVTSFNGGIGRLDTIAHELGHNLGLYEGPGAVGGHDNSNANFLMASGSVRNVPSSLGEICPDPGALTCYGLLSADHIATARGSKLLVDIVPEPSALALVGLALFAAGVAQRRRA